MKKISNKFKILFSILIIGIILPIFIVCAFYKPTTLNKYIVNKLYNEPVNSYFKDQNFYNCVIDAYNSENKTSYAYTYNLSDEELASITKLSCGGYSENKIIDASGLDKLTGLTSLILQYNKLTEIDVSKNVALKELNVSVSQLTKLDVSKNTSLTSLSAHDNKLTEIDVSQNTLLTDLYVYANQLTKLDVSKNAALITLYVYANQLTKLDVSKNTSLKYLHVSNNQLTELDVSKNTSLTDLYASDNQLTELDVSQNTLLTYLFAYNNQLTKLKLDVSGTTALTSLSAYNNQLTELDVSNNTSLTSLSVNNNKLTVLDVSGATSLTSLSAYNNQLTELDVSNNTSLTSLSVYNNQLTELDVSDNTALTELSVGNNKLTVLDVSNNTALTSLSVFSNQLMELDVSKNTKLKILYAESNKLKQINISNNDNLEELYLSDNQLTDLDVGSNIKLKELVLGYWLHTSLYGISGNAKGNLITTLNISNNTLLTSLSVYDNQLTELDVSKNTALTELSVYGNNFQNEQTVYINKLTNITSPLIPSENKSNVINSYDLNSNKNITIDKDNNTIISDKVGEYNISLSYKHDYNHYTISSAFYDVNYTLYVEELSSSKYGIDNAKTTIYLSNNETIDKNIINNLSVNYATIEYSDNKIKVKDKDNVLEEFTIDRIKLTSTKYGIDNTNIKIYVPNNEVIDNNIINNLNVNYGTIEYSDNKIKVKDGNNVLEEFTIDRIQLSSTKYGIDNTKTTIYVSNNEIIDNNIINNLSVNYGTIEYSNNKIKVKDDDNILEEFTIDKIKLSSTKYVIDNTNTIIYVPNSEVIDENIINNLSSNYGTIEYSDNKIKVKDKDNVLEEYTIGKIKLNSSNDSIKIYDNVIAIPDELTYEEFTSSVTVTNLTYKIYNNEEEITSGNITSDMIVNLYYNNSLFDSYTITKDYINLDNFNIKNNYILDINDNTKVSDFKSKIDTNGNISIYNNSDLLNDDDIIGTGYKLVIELSNTSIEYVLVVNGDVTGDGEVNTADAFIIIRHSLEISLLENEYFLAGDIDSDNELTTADAFKVIRYSLGIDGLS